MPYRDARRLPVLDCLRIASPCDQPWHALPGDERVRLCHRCEKRVYNLSALTRKEAELLLMEHEGPICVTFYKRADGTVITSDCEVGARQARARQARLATAAAAAMAATALAGLGAQTAPAPAPVFDERVSVDQDYGLRQHLGAVREVEAEEPRQPGAGAFPKRRRPVPRPVMPKPSAR